MSIRIMTRVWDESPYSRDLLLAHLAMADFANDEGYFWAKQTSIAAKTRCTPRYVKMIVARMAEDGYLRVVKKGRRNTYYLTWPDPIGETSSPSIGEIHDSDRGTPVPPHIEPSVEPSVRNRQRDTATPPGRGRNQRGDSVGDPRLEDKEPEFEDAPRTTKTRKKETSHLVCKRYFTNQAKSRHRIDHVGLGLLDKTITTLRDMGLSYDEITDYMEHWFSRKDAEIRKKRTSRDPLDLARWFRQSINDGMVEVWQRETFTRVNTTVNSAFGAETLNEKLGLG